MRSLKNLVKSSLRFFDIGIMRQSALEELKAKAAMNAADANVIAAGDIDLLLALPNEHAPQLLRYLRKSRSQLRQDLFVLSQLNFKTNGFFVEFGATNGITLSNTYLLETEFGWSGILAEPAKCWTAELCQNLRAHIELNCVWKDSNSTLVFNEVTYAELSTVNSYSDTDSNGDIRKQGKTYSVETISLRDLLKKYDAPVDIDYLSIDTEGSEFDVLNNFPFCDYSFKVITCEHNFTPMREKIYALLTNNGYIRRFPELSKFDDWYVRAGWDSR